MLNNVKIFLDKVSLFVIISQVIERCMMIISSGLMTIEDLADYLKVTRRTIYDWLKHDKIPAVKLVGQWRFKKDKIDAWLDGQTKQH